MSDVHARNGRTYAPRVAKVMRDVTVSGHLFERGRMQILFQCRGAEMERGVAFTKAQAPGLVHELVCHKRFGDLVGSGWMRMQYWDRYNAVDAMLAARPPELLQELRRIRRAVVAVGASEVAEAQRAKRDECRKELREFVRKAKTKWGFDLDDMEELMAEEVKLLRVEEVQTG